MRLLAGEDVSDECGGIVGQLLHGEGSIGLVVHGGLAKAAMIIRNHLMPECGETPRKTVPVLLQTGPTDWQKRQNKRARRIGKRARRHAYECEHGKACACVERGSEVIGACED